MTRIHTSGLERFSLSGRIVLITGATRGLGLEIARGMAAAGAVVGECLPRPVRHRRPERRGGGHRRHRGAARPHRLPREQRGRA